MNSKTNQIIIADIVSMVIFSFLTGAMVEIFISNLSLLQILKSRFTAIPVNILVARPFGIYRDFFLNKLKTDNQDKMRNVILDTIIFTSFKVPIYATILFFAKADSVQIFKSCLAVSIFSSIFGRSYGIFLEYTRNYVYKYSNNYSKGLKA